MMPCLAIDEFADLLQDMFDIVFKFFVAEPYYADPVGMEKCRAFGVFQLCLDAVMDASVYFDAASDLWTVEVHHVDSVAVLLPELQILHLPVSAPFP